MGAYLSQANLTKESHDDENESFSFGSSAMQGWRLGMEDAVSSRGSSVSHGWFVVYRCCREPNTASNSTWPMDLELTLFMLWKLLSKHLVNPERSCARHSSSPNISILLICSMSQCWTWTQKQLFLLYMMAMEVRLETLIVSELWHFLSLSSLQGFNCRARELKSLAFSNSPQAIDWRLNKSRFKR